MDFVAPDLEIVAPSLEIVATGLDFVAAGLEFRPRQTGLGLGLRRACPQIPLAEQEVNN